MATSNDTGRCAGPVRIAEIKLANRITGPDGDFIAQVLNPATGVPADVRARFAARWAPEHTADDDPDTAAPARWW